MTRRMLLFALVIVAGCDRPAPRMTSRARAGAPVERLLRLMKERLAVMPDVARWKWAADAPIEDREREEEILRAVGEEAAEHGLDPDLARRFFAAQMEASKRVQRAAVDHWRGRGEPKTTEGVPSLAELRRRLDALNESLIAALAEAHPQMERKGADVALRRAAEEILAGEFIDERVRATALRPLLDLAM